MRVTTLCIR